MRISNFLAATFFAAFSTAVRAADIATAHEAATGVWIDSFAMATNLSFATKAPLVMFWANFGCGECALLEDAVETEEFKSWMAGTPYVYCFVEGKSGDDVGINAKSGAKEFAQTANGTRDRKDRLTQYPFICLYWPKSDGTQYCAAFTGRTGDMGVSAAGRTLAQEFREAIEKAFSSYSPVPEYLGGDLAFTNRAAYARLEAEIGFTRYVDIPLSRDAAAAVFEATNRIAAAKGGVALASDTIVWKKSESRRMWRLAIPADAAAGETIDVELYDEKGTKRGDTGVYIVSPQENSTDNPFFIGEKTAETLGYGEWTMDLDVAMAKYKSEPGSHLVAVASGSRWCPDCVMADHHVLETPQFKTWATENKVILVDIDVPNFGPNEGTSACLLTRTVGRTSDGYISGRGTIATNETKRFQSGAGYLSRHMIADSSAEAVLERNRSLVGRNTLQGGWNNPDRANQNRTGIPNFFALNRDGSIAATFETFDAIGPKEFKDEYIARFDELIAAEDAGDDISDRSWATTKRNWSGEAASTAGGELSVIDLQDVYAIPAASTTAASQRVAIKGAAKGVTVAVSLLSVSEGAVTTIATSTGLLENGVSVEGVIGSTGSYYIQISATGSGALDPSTAAAGVSAAYTVSGLRTPIENPFENAWTKTAASATLPLFSESSGELDGVLVLSLKKTGRISAKLSNGRKTLASFTGKWSDDITIEGVASATMEKRGWTLYLEIDADGWITAEATDGSSALAGGPYGIATDYSEMNGAYTVAMPREDGGAPVVATLSSTGSAAKKGKMKFAAYLPNGKKLSGSTGVAWIDANFGIVTVLKANATDTFRATLKVRRNAMRAPTPRAVVASGFSRWSSTYSGDDVFLDAYGSLVGKNTAITNGVESEILEFDAAWEGVSSDIYGAVTNAAGDAAGIAVSAFDLDKAANIKGWSFSYKQSTGVFTGKLTMSAENKKSIVAKYTGVVVPGWFSDCDCGEDDDEIIGRVNRPYGEGFAIYTDKALVSGRKKSVKRSIPVGIVSAGK